MNDGIGIAVVDVAPVLQVTLVFVAAAVPPRHSVPEAPIVRVLFPGPVTPVSKFKTPEVIVKAPLDANVGVAPELTTVVAEEELMVRL